MILQELQREAMSQIGMNAGWKEDHVLPRQVLEEYSQGKKSDNKL